MKKTVHFMGIGGSGMSGVALLAKAQNYIVTGCDQENSTPYLEKIKKKGIKVYLGHDSRHLKGVDILAVTPAAFFQNEKHPEVIQGKKKLMTWQAFLGRFLQKGKKVICVAGTHGKSTTTSMLTLLFEDANLKPWAMVGATIPKWDSNALVGKSNIFITESDEFFDNFLNYKPEIIILNNVELDHPDYFKSERQLFDSFSRHIKSLKGEKILIFNQDSLGVCEVLKRVGEKFLDKIKLIGYTTEENPLISCNTSLKAQKIQLLTASTKFRVKGENIKIEDDFQLTVPGIYNVSNALGVIAAALVFKIPLEVVKKSLSSYKGIGRRLELIGDKNGVLVYDDYAHHPTAARLTLQALRQKYPKKRILAIVEPHTYSRTRALLPFYKNAFEAADLVCIVPIFKSRDNSDFGISGQNIVDISDHKNIFYLNSFEKTILYFKKYLKSGDVLLVMGAGKSYQLARDIYESI